MTSTKKTTVKIKRHPNQPPAREVTRKPYNKRGSDWLSLKPQIERMAAEGLSCCEMLRVLGKPRNKVSSLRGYMSKWGVTNRIPKLDDDTLEKARQLKARRFTYGEIATLLDINEDRLSRAFSDDAAAGQAYRLKAPAADAAWDFSADNLMVRD